MFLSSVPLNVSHETDVTLHLKKLIKDLLSLDDQRMKHEVKFADLLKFCKLTILGVETM